jgi:hypothetical protein
VQVEAYIQAMTGLGKHLLGMLALSLELPENYFADGLDNPMITTASALSAAAPRWRWQPDRCRSPYRLGHDHHAPAG